MWAKRGILIHKASSLLVTAQRSLSPGTSAGSWQLNIRRQRHSISLTLTRLTTHINKHNTIRQEVQLKTHVSRFPTYPENEPLPMSLLNKLNNIDVFAKFYTHLINTSAHTVVVRSLHTFILSECTSLNLFGIFFNIRSHIQTVDGSHTQWWCIILYVFNTLF